MVRGVLRLALWNVQRRLATVALIAIPAAALFALLSFLSAVSEPPPPNCDEFSQNNLPCRTAAYAATERPSRKNTQRDAQTRARRRRP